MEPPKNSKPTPSKPSKGIGVPVFDPDPLAALRVHNLTQSFYVKTPTPADGNCYYHGIEDQKITQMYMKHYQKVASCAKQHINSVLIATNLSMQVSFYMKMKLSLLHR